MADVNPVRELEKLPMPEPSDVFVLRAVVGLADVFQHTPRAVTEAPPSLVIFPPLVAVVEVMEPISVVERLGTTGAAGLVVKLNSLP